MAARKGIIKAPGERSLVERQQAAKELLDQAERDRQASVPANTQKAYQSDWVNLEAWCREWDREPLLGREPDAVERDRHEQTLLLYLSYMSKADYKPASIERALSGICFVHRQEKRPNPKTPLVRQQLRGIKNNKKRPPEQSAPILAADLMAMMKALHAEKLSVRDLRDRAALLTAWAGCLRRSELTGLRRRDVVFTKFKQADESMREGMLLTLIDTKTDKTGEVVVAVVAATHPLVCPVRAMREWLEVRDCAAQRDHVFSRSFRETVELSKPMPAWQLESVVQRWAQAAELKPENPAQRYTPHSLRAGPITQAGIDGMPDWKIMEHSRHETYAVFRKYIRTNKLGQDHPLAKIVWGK